jgi:peptidoglycan/LPS O-acetylase OafA/YrhL
MSVTSVQTKLPDRNYVQGRPVAIHREDYYSGFDYLRGILALTVVLGHEGVIAWSDSPNFAVQVFFALSGWLIGSILLRMSPHDLPRFYFNRAIRIWIPYYIAVALLVAASLLHDPLTGKWFEFVVYDLSFVYNLFGPPQLAQHIHEMPLQGTANHFWSVNAEEQFYLIAPLLLVLAAAKVGRSMHAWAAIAIIVWALAIYAGHKAGYPSIVLGVLASIVVGRYGPIHLQPLGRFFLILSTALSALGIALGFDYVLLAPLCAISIVLLLAVKSPQTRLGEIVGGMSYPLYLNHWIGVFIGHTLLRPFGLRDSAVRILFSTLLAISIAVAHYWFIERRILAQRGRLFSPQRGFVITCTAYILIFAGLLFGVAIGAPVR